MDNMTIYDVCNECLYRMTHHFRDDDIGEFYKYMTILKQIVNENLIISPDSFTPQITTVSKDSDLLIKRATATFETDFYFDKRMLPTDCTVDEMCKEEFIKKIEHDSSAKSDKYWKAL